MKQDTDKTDRRAVGWLAAVLSILSLISAVAVPAGLFPIISLASSASGEPVVQEPSLEISIPLSGPTPTSTAIPVTSTPHITRVGVIAGHSGSDPGAVCPDSLQEVQINIDVARRVVALLAQRGWEVDLLQEFDPRLNNYRADVLISIHADSCAYPGKSGFKVTRAESSFIPGSEDRLVDCLIRHYQQQTALEFDAHTITYDMTRYHAFYEIDRNTPAVIIETGFMLDDRELLTQRPDTVALGIFHGLVCFLEGE
ncbi:MAG TPA: hypothetical protein ENN14_00490 [Chloroflexi bacterium]|nr:hypothetical protein [Chloroflexota bacterium]